MISKKEIKYFFKKINNNKIRKNKNTKYLK